MWKKSVRLEPELKQVNRKSWRQLNTAIYWTQNFNLLQSFDVFIKFQVVQNDSNEQAHHNLCVTYMSADYFSM